MDIRNDFPILKRTFYDKPLVYLDSAATTQKPRSVIDAIDHYYAHSNANVHRGIYRLSEEATAIYESGRKSVRALINAPKEEEIIFTRGTTESINLVAYSFGEAFVKAGDEVLITAMEHHSNIVPWQILCERKGATLKVIPISDEGVVDLNAFQKLLSDRVKILSIVHVSNALGVVNPIKSMIAMAHEYDIPVMIDGAQALPHMDVDVVDLDCDFYAFSAHKMYGPTGIGALYGKSKWLNQMPPYQSGGDMINRVSFEKSTYNVLPHKFEAGTPNMAGVAGFEAAVKYLTKARDAGAIEHEASLYAYAHDQLNAMAGLRIIANTKQKSGAISFVLDEVHPHDISTILDQEAIAVRAGHHCTMPLMDRLGLAATVRASIGLYNTTEDIDKLCVGLEKVKQLFGVS